MYTQVQITCTGQLPVADTPPQPAGPPVGTLTDTLMSPPQSSGSTNTQSQNTNTGKRSKGRQCLKWDKDTFF